MAFALKKEFLPHYTYEDYCKWEGRWELIDGVPYAMSPLPSLRHQDIGHKHYCPTQKPCKGELQKLPGFYAHRLESERTYSCAA